MGARVCARPRVRAGVVVAFLFFVSFGHVAGAVVLAPAVVVLLSVSDDVSASAVDGAF